MNENSLGFWFWFWVWAGLGVSALVVLAFIGKSLYNRLLSAAHQGERIMEKVASLTSALEQKPTLEKPRANLNDEPQLAVARLNALKKVKNKKKQDRQRRLIASLRNFDPNESRFH